MRKYEINKIQIVIREFGASVKDILSDPNECQKWLKNFHDCLIYGVNNVSDYGDKVIAEAQEFNDKQRKKITTYWQGKKEKKNEPNPTTNELYDFAQSKKIPDGIARQFYEICEYREWKDKSGKPIVNWKGALINFAITIKQKQQQGEINE